MVTAMHPLAAQVGADMLEKGGGAIDAAVATAFAVGVVEPFMSGVGGIAFMVYRDAATGQTVCFDGSSVLPDAIRPELFELLAPDVPGTPHLLGEAHRRYGRLPWAEVLRPAIELAERGFEVDPYVGMFIS